MKKLVILLILLAAVIFTAGCTDKSQDNSTNTQAVQNSNGVVETNESEQSAILKETQEGNGIVETNRSEQNTSQKTQEGSSVLQVTSLKQINTSLEQGPVLVKIGSKHCGPCQAMRPMLKELATEYNGKATIASIDITESPDLEAYFEIGYVPDTSLIVGIEDGDYVYMQEDGTVTKDRFKARIQGQMEKEVYENRINLALLKEGKST